MSCPQLSGLMTRPERDRVVGGRTQPFSTTIINACGHGIPLLLSSPVLPFPRNHARFATPATE
jgi:hypothetical protein